jgi:phosphoribosylformylglycinamidine cyclo-ligase
VAGESQLYSKLGASSSKKGIIAAVGAPQLAHYFCEPLSDAANDPEYYSFLHADGVGTKSITSYIAFRESDDPQYFRSLAQDSLVMNLDDLACVGAFEGLVLSNTIGRNPFRIPDAVVQEIVTGYQETCNRLAEQGITIRLAGGETADLADLVRTVVIDSTLFGRVAKNNIIRASGMQVGDVIVGLGSTGRTRYEIEENSGLGSNGFTMARHALISKKYVEKYPEISDSSALDATRYKGRYDLFDTPVGMTQTVAAALLSPTRSYAPLIAEIHRELRDDLHSVIHCSGGGQTKLLRFGSGFHFVKDNLFSTPAVCREIQAALNVPWQEMYAVFNMGHRMEVFVPESTADQVVSLAKQFDIEARVVGRVKDGKGQTSLHILSENGEFRFS